jgi:cytochrome c553
MRLRPTFVALLALLVAGFVRAEGDAGAGAARYAACASCHGGDGGGEQALQAPRLTHLQPAYLSSQLRKFKSGLRGGNGASASAVQMAGMAATLADGQAIADVVAYIGTLESDPSAATITGDPQLGGDYYNQFCGACHGARAEGNPALDSPRLAGSDDWYLMAQLEAFRSGQRGAHPDDRTGRQMKAMAALLPDEKAMADVVAFIRSLAAQ